jgi:hypothetical protein
VTIGSDEMMHLAQSAVSLMVGMVASTSIFAVQAHLRVQRRAYRPIAGAAVDADRPPPRQIAPGPGGGLTGRDLWLMVVAGLATLGLVPPDIRLALVPSGIGSRIAWSSVLLAGGTGIALGFLLSVIMYWLGRKQILRA